MNKSGLEFGLEKTAGMFGDLYHGAGTLRKSMGVGGSTIFGDINAGLNSGVAKDAYAAAGQLGNIVGKAGIGAAKATVGIALGVWGAKKIIDGLMNDHTRKALLEDLLLNDIIISQADPEKVKSFYATIHHLAPKLSGDKNIVRELLQNFVKFDRVDMNSIKAMADTQKSMSNGDTSLISMLR